MDNFRQYQLPHQCGTFIITDEPTLTHHHPKSIFVLVSCCIFYEFGKRKSDMYPPLYYQVDSFQCPKNPLLLTYSSSLLPTTGNCWSFHGLDSFAFSKLSYSWKHIACWFFRRMLSLSNIHLRILHVFLWHVVHFFLKHDNFSLPGCIPVYPLTYWRTSYLLPALGNHE